MAQAGYAGASPRFGTVGYTPVLRSPRGECGPAELPGRSRRALVVTRLPLLSSPLLLGFDEIERLVDRVGKAGDGYPPYNIERITAGESRGETLRITLAVAGFTREQLDITLEDNQLSIRGKQDDDNLAAPSCSPKASRSNRPTWLTVCWRSTSCGTNRIASCAVSRSRNARNPSDPPNKCAAGATTQFIVLPPKQHSLFRRISDDADGPDSIRAVLIPPAGSGRAPRTPHRRTEP
jgi:hypothetical protein